MKNHDHDQLKPPFMTGYSDTYIKLAKNRILFISEDINNIMAAELSAMLLYLDNQECDSPIEIYIHSNGGDVSGLANIYDVMQMIKSPIKTICVGKCYSAAAVILASGTKGMRYAFKNSSIMIHGIQFSFPIPGHDMTTSKSYFDFVKNNNDNILKILAYHTGLSLDKVKSDCKEDVWMSSVEAIKYGLIDHIIA